MGVDSVGVDEGELGEGLFPAGGGLAFDEVPVGFAFGAAAEAGFLGAVAGSFVFDGADGQPQQFEPSRLSCRSHTGCSCGVRAA